MIAGFLAYPHLPEKCPTHWNFPEKLMAGGSAGRACDFFMFPLNYVGPVGPDGVLTKIDL
jgi:uncharacterized membrane protein